MTNPNGDTFVTAGDGRDDGGAAATAAGDTSCRRGDNASLGRPRRRASPPSPAPTTVESSAASAPRRGVRTSTLLGVRTWRDARGGVAAAVAAAARAAPAAACPPRRAASFSRRSSRARSSSGTNAARWCESARASPVNTSPMIASPRPKRRRGSERAWWRRACEAGSEGGGARLQPGLRRRRLECRADLLVGLAGELWVGSEFGEGHLLLGGAHRAPAVRGRGGGSASAVRGG